MKIIMRYKYLIETSITLPLHLLRSCSNSTHHLGEVPKIIIQEGVIILWKAKMNQIKAIFSSKTLILDVNRRRKRLSKMGLKVVE